MTDIDKANKGWNFFCDENNYLIRKNLMYEFTFICSGQFDEHKFNIWLYETKIQKY